MESWKQNNNILWWVLCTEQDSLLGMRLLWFHITIRNQRAFTRNDFLLTSSKIPETTWPRNTKAKAKIYTSFPRLIVVKIQDCGGDCFLSSVLWFFPTYKVFVCHMSYGFLSVLLFRLLYLLCLSIQVVDVNSCSDRIETWIYNYICQL